MKLTSVYSENFVNQIRTFSILQSTMPPWKKVHLLLLDSQQRVTFYWWMSCLQSLGHILHPQIQVSPQSIFIPIQKERTSEFLVIRHRLPLKSSKNQPKLYFPAGNLISGEIEPQDTRYFINAIALNLFQAFPQGVKQPLWQDHCIYNEPLTRNES